MHEAHEEGIEKVKRGQRAILGLGKTRPGEV